MKSLRTFIIAVLLFSIIYMNLSTSSANTVFDLNNCGTVLDVFPGNGESFYILSRYQNNYKVTLIDNNFNVTSNILDINAADTSYAYRSGMFYFFINEYKNENNTPFHYVTIKKYNAAANSFTSSVINNVELRQNATFAYNGSNWYLLDPESVKIFSNNYKQIDEIRLNSYGYNLFLAGDGSTIFCTTDNEILSINDSSVTAFSLNTAKIYTYENYFSDDNSIIYDAYNSGIVFDGFSPSSGTAKLGNWFIGNSSGRLTAISGSNSCDIGTASTDSFICGSGGVCGCFTPNGSNLSVQIVSLDEIEEKYQSQNSSTNNQSSNGTAGNYEFDNVQNIITGITPGTTPAQFRKKCGLNDPIIFDNNGNVKTSGHVGTGMTVTSSDGSSYTLIIFGDVTGEGNINSRDLKIIEDQILTGTVLEDKYLLAADVIHDGKIDLKDASAIYQDMKDKYEIDQNSAS